jgi:hypothetical protein
MTGWITNDPEIARLLRKADTAYQNARRRAMNLPLDQKVKALHQADITRAMAYTELDKLDG